MSTSASATAAAKKPAASPEASGRPVYPGVAADAEPTATIKGQVFDDDGQPLDNIQVEAFAAGIPNGDPVASDLTYEYGDVASHGAYELAVPAGTYVVRFSSPDWADRNVYETVYYGGGAGDDVTVADGGSVTLDDVTLYPDHGVPLTGHVQDSTGGPMAGMRVELLRFARNADWGFFYVDQAVTDAAGDYTFEGVNRSRSYTVMVDGFMDSEGTYLGLPDVYLGQKPSAGLAQRVSLAADAGATTVDPITMVPGVAVSGTAQPADGTTPGYVTWQFEVVLPDGSREWARSIGTWGTEGRFESHLLPGFDYTVAVSVDPDWSTDPTYLGDTIDPDQATTFTLGDTDRDLGAITIGADTAKLHVRVLDADGDPASYSDGEVEVLHQVGDSFESVGDAYATDNGDYTKSIVQGEAYTVRVIDYHTGAAVYLGGGTDEATATTVTAEAGQQTVDAGTITLSGAAAKVRGSVLDADGNGITGASVELIGFRDGCPRCAPVLTTRRTDSTGAYSLPVSPWAQTRFDSFTVLADGDTVDYGRAYLGDVQRRRDATRLTVGDTGATADPIHLDQVTGLVRGTLVDSDGAPVTQGTLVVLDRWTGFDGGGGYWQAVGFDWVTDGTFRFADQTPGTYAVTAEVHSASGVTLIGGTAGGILPSGPAAPGTFDVVSADPTVVPPITMSVPARIDGHVTLAGGAPIADGLVYLEYWKWSAADNEFQPATYSTTREPDGALPVSLIGLPPGSYAVRATYYLDNGDFSGYYSGWSTGTAPTSPDDAGVVTLAEGETGTVNVELPKVGIVTGRVVDESGDPVADADVTLYGNCTWSAECSTVLDEVTTDADGEYTYAPGSEISWIGADKVTMYVTAEDGGFTPTWAGGGTDQSGAVYYDLGQGDIRADDIQLTPYQAVVRGRVLAPMDGPALGDHTMVSIFHWDEIAGDFRYDGTRDVRGSRFAFRDIGAGSYAFAAVSRNYDSSTPYVTTWLGGAKPTGLDDPGVVTVSTDGDPSVPVDAGTITMDPGVELSGVVRSTGGIPLGGTSLTVSYPGFDADQLAWLDDDGHYTARVPAGAPVWFSIYRNGFGTPVAIGDETNPALTAGDAATTYDITLDPQWGAIGSGAGQQLEYCLAHESSSIDFDGNQLQVSGGEIFLADLWPDGDPFAAGSDVPVLAPLGGDYSARFTTWGVSPDGQTLCVQWGGDGSAAVYQALLTKAGNGDLDVVYNYDTVPWTYSDASGYTDGVGTSVMFPDGADGGYADGAPGGLVDHNLGSDVNGQYAFHFVGFGAGVAAPQPETRPWIRGRRYIGETLTADPGTWVINGEPADGVTFTYRWFRGTTTLGTGPTYEVTPADFHHKVRLEVRASLPGHRAGRAVQGTWIHGGEVAASVQVAPSLSPASPNVGDEITLDPGTWAPAADLTEADLSYTYQWFRDGRRITGASGTTYTTTDADELTQITARVLVSGAGHATNSRSTNGVRVAERTPLAATTAPTLTGEPKVGNTLTVDPGTWDDDAVTYSYDWYVDYRQRTADAGDGSAYTLTSADRGSIVTVVVTAHAPGRRDGEWSTTVGPVAAADAQLVPLTVHVRDDATDGPVAGVYVSVCERVTWSCLPGDRTDAQGDFTGQAIAGTTYYVDAYPSEPYRTASTTLTTGTSAAEATVRLTQPAPPPPNVSIPTSNGTVDGTTPMVYWQEDQEFEVTGCAGVTDPTYTVTFADGTAPRTGDLTQGAVGGDGLATYSATIPAFYPSHGDITISTNVPADCADGTEPTSVQVYIDPSGVVTDQYGRTIAGATVTLLRSDNAGGPFAVVPDGSDVMSEANRTNPDTTDANGFFQWDVSAGWYRVRATAPGCTTVSTDPMDVPPPRIDLLIKLSCGSAAPAPAITVTGTPKVGATLTAGTGSWGDLTAVTNQWRRDGNNIDGATASTYVLTADDLGHDITVKQIAQRPTYVQDSGRGVPVTFTAASATSAPQTVTAGDKPTAAERPALTGSPAVGKTLTAPDPAWSDPAVTTTRQWKVDGTAVDGETGATYQVRPADLGKTILVTYVGKLAGHTDGTVDSQEVTAVTGDAIGVLAKPTIAGTPKVGSTLTATAPTWSMDGVTTSDPQWSVAGAPVDGETGSTYVVRPADVGKAVTVSYTGTKHGYKDGTATSDPVTALLGDAPGVTTRPTITGEAKAGATLTATAPVWATDGVTTSAPQWSVGGVPVDGETGTTYVVRDADVGRSITVAYRGTKDGYAEAVATSLAFAIPAPGGGGGGGGTPAPATMTVVTAPQISGTPKVGSTLSVSAPVWSVDGVETSAPRWTVGGAPVTAADDGTYVVAAGDVGKAIQVSFTGTKVGYTEGVAITDPVTAIAGDAPEAVEAPVVSGDPVVGSTLTATPGTWSTDGLAFTYQWMRAGAAIDGATGDSYVTTVDDLGSAISVLVTASRVGYADGAAESAGVVVVKHVSTTTAKAKKRVVKAGRPVVLATSVSVPGMAPIGRLIVRVDGKKYRGYRLTVAAHGARMVRVAHLQRGRHTVTVEYTGNQVIAGSTARPIRVRVLGPHHHQHHRNGLQRVSVPSLW